MHVRPELESVASTAWVLGCNALKPENQFWMMICIIACYLLDAWFIGSLDRFQNVYDLIQLLVSTPIGRRAAVAYQV